MDEYESRARHREDGFSRFARYLRTRPGEVWLFFAAGLLVGLILG